MIYLQVRRTPPVVYQALVGAIAMEWMPVQEFVHVGRNVVCLEIMSEIRIDFLVRKIPLGARRSEQVENTAAAGKRQIGKVPFVPHVVQRRQPLFKINLEEDIGQGQAEYDEAGAVRRLFGSFHEVSE